MFMITKNSVSSGFLQHLSLALASLPVKFLNHCGWPWTASCQLFAQPLSLTMWKSLMTMPVIQIIKNWLASQGISAIDTVMQLWCNPDFYRGQTILQWTVKSCWPISHPSMDWQNWGSQEKATTRSAGDGYISFKDHMWQCPLNCIDISLISAAGAHSCMVIICTVGGRKTVSEMIS